MDDKNSLLVKLDLILTNIRPVQVDPSQLRLEGEDRRQVRQTIEACVCVLRDIGDRIRDWKPS